MGKFFSCLTRMSLRPSSSRKRNALSTQEDHRGRFYNDYHMEAEECDRDFIKKYDEDLDMTLIFVSSVRSPGLHVLTRVTGRFILRCHYCFHH